MTYRPTLRTDEHPDPAGPGIGAPFFSTWRVGDPLRQRRTVEAIAGTWEKRPWPADGLRGYHVYTGHDGGTLLHYSQWTSEDAYEAFVATHRRERVDEIDTAVPGIERVGLDRYRHYRSLERAACDRRVPGLIVTVRIDFAGGAADRRADWIDRVVEYPGAQRGLIAAHFHLSTDGGHALNYAEWETEEAYDKVIAQPVDEAWERIRTHPDVTGFRGARYRHALGLVPG